MWRKIKGYKNFSVSDSGEVRNDATSHILKPWIATGGYLNVALCENGNKETKRVHRLVAETFIPNSNSVLQVNHIDGDKHNNRADNLEWITKSENMNHAYRTGLQSKVHQGKVRSVICLNDGNFFNTISEASEHYGVSKSQIYWCCRRESKRCKLKFRFAERSRQKGEANDHI